MRIHQNRSILLIWGRKLRSHIGWSHNPLSRVFCCTNLSTCDGEPILRQPAIAIETVQSHHSDDDIFAPVVVQRFIISARKSLNIGQSEAEQLVTSLYLDAGSSYQRRKLLDFRFLEYQYVLPHLAKHLSASEILFNTKILFNPNIFDRLSKCSRFGINPIRLIHLLDQTTLWKMNQSQLKENELVRGNLDMIDSYLRNTIPQAELRERVYSKLWNKFPNFEEMPLETFESTVKELYPQVIDFDLIETLLMTLNRRIDSQTAQSIRTLGPSPHVPIPLLALVERGKFSSLLTINPDQIIQKLSNLVEFFGLSVEQILFGSHSVRMLSSLLTGIDKLLNEFGVGMSRSPLLLYILAGSGKISHDRHELLRQHHKVEGNFSCKILLDQISPLLTKIYTFLILEKLKSIDDPDEIIKLESRLRALQALFDVENFDMAKTNTLLDFLVDGLNMKPSWIMSNPEIVVLASVEKLQEITNSDWKTKEESRILLEETLATLLREISYNKEKLE